MPRSWLVLTAALVAFPATADAQETRTARLIPSPIEAATVDELTGLGTATAVLGGTVLTITGSFD